MNINLILDHGKKYNTETIEKMYGNKNIKKEDFNNKDNPEDKYNIVLIDKFYELYINFIKLNVYLFIIHFLQNIQDNNIFKEYINLKKEYLITYYKKNNIKGGKKSRRTKNKNSKKRSYTKRR